MAKYLALLLVFHTFVLPSDFKVVGYYTSWAQFRADYGKFVPEDIDGNLLTHVIYAFAKFDKFGNVNPVEHNDLSTSKVKGMYERFNNIKLAYPHLKTLLSVGGEIYNGASFLEVLSNSKRRKKLAKSLVNFAIKNGFDGVDIDWEFEKSTAKSKSKCYLLVKLINEINYCAKCLGENNFLVTVVAGLRTVSGASKCIKKVSQISDWLNIIGYDFHGSWDSYTDANAPLYSDNSSHSTYYIDHLIKKYIRFGVDPQKLVLGVPAYGRSYGNVFFDKSVSPRNSSSGPGRQGRHVKQEGILSYYEIDEMLEEGFLSKAWDVKTSTPYAYNLQTKEWVSYDNPLSISLKTQYAKKMNLGGMMLWALPLDDFHNGYPLLMSINEELYK